MPTSAPQSDGRLLANLMHFRPHAQGGGAAGRAGKVLDAVAAVEAVGNRRPARFLLDIARGAGQPCRPTGAVRPGVSRVLAQPRAVEEDARPSPPELNIEMPQAEGAEMLRRLAEALHPNQPAKDSGETELEIDAAMSFSEKEQLHAMDFEKMSLESWPAPRRRSPGCVCRSTTSRRGAMPGTRAAPAPTCAPPCARTALGRAHRAEAQEPAPPAAAACRTVRHLGVDEPLQPGLSAFHALDHQ